ncbi:MAG: glycosyltransferase [Alphaproteobacteria bacterium]|nr:glycosyltransferase [Alphaproteobacteria bacterium]
MTGSVAGADILFFLCLNDRGGAEISMLRLAEALRAHGRGVTVAAYGAHPELARELGFGGDIIDLGARRTWAAFFPLRRLLRRKNFPVVISALTHTNIVAALAAPPAMRVIVTEHGIDGVAALACRPLFAALVRYAYGSAALICVSHALAEQWRKAAPRLDINAIYNPVVADQPAPVPPPAHEWLKNKNVILGIGRLKEEKNFALLLRAFAAVAQGRDVRLVILGEGPQRALLENLARELGVADRVLLPGFAAEPRGWLAYAALLVCPSKREGFGNVLVEALAEGVPVVSADCPYGPAEILDHGRYGRLTPVDDVAAMARAMRAALDEVSDAAGLRLRAAAFGVSRCLEAYLAVMDSPSRARRS